MHEGHRYLSLQVSSICRIMGTDLNRVPDFCRSAVLLTVEARRQYLASASAVADV